MFPQFIYNNCISITIQPSITMVSILAVAIAISKWAVSTLLALGGFHIFAVLPAIYCEMRIYECSILALALLWQCSSKLSFEILISLRLLKHPFGRCDSFNPSYRAHLFFYTFQLNTSSFSLKHFGRLFNLVFL